MTGIDLSPEMVDRASERDCYDVLAVCNTESVVLLPAAADPPPDLNAPLYADVKFKVLSVNVNRTRVRNGNGQCVGGGGGGGGKHRCQKQCLYFDVVFACDVLVYIADLRSLFQSVWGSLILPPPTTAEETTDNALMGERRGGSGSGDGSSKTEYKTY